MRASEEESGGAGVEDDAVVVRREVRKARPNRLMLRDLRGKWDFFRHAINLVRQGASQVGLPMVKMSVLDASPSPIRLRLVVVRMS